MDKLEQLNKFAEKLKNTREKNNITLSQIFEDTRIDIKYLEAIESGNFDVMPEFYIRAFLREYGSAIGLDGEELLSEYNSISKGNFEQENEEKQKIVLEKQKVLSEVPIFEPDIDKINEEPLKKNPSPDKKTLIIIASAVILVLIVYLSFFNNSSTEIVKETPYNEIIAGKAKPKAKGYEEIKKSTEAQEKESEKKSETISKKNNFTSGAELNLFMKGIDTSWVRVMADGRMQGEFLIYPGIKKNFSASKYYSLLIGNSAGVELYLNGKKLLFSGAKGRIRNLFINKEGIKYLKIKKNKNNE